MEKLYPIGYDEAKDAPAKPAPDLSSRDERGATDLIAAAVPEGGSPLTVDQLEALICGRYVRGENGAFLPMDAAVDASQDLPRALTAVLTGKPLRGPAAFSGILPSRVRELIQGVIEERRASWKLLDAATALAVEEKPL